MQQQIQAEEEETAATPVAPHVGPEAATRVYPQRKRNSEAARRAQEQSERVITSTSASPLYIYIYIHPESPQFVDLLRRGILPVPFQ